MDEKKQRKALASLGDARKQLPQPSATGRTRRRLASSETLIEQADLLSLCKANSRTDS
jgi:hypothetical protein